MPVSILPLGLGFARYAEVALNLSNLSANPHCSNTTKSSLLASVPVLPMSLVPRWRYLTDEAKALTKRTAASALVVLFVLMLFRALVPWVVLALVASWIWAAVRK